MKKVIAILIAALMFILTGCYSSDDLEDARQEGYREGYEEGYEKGVERGYNMALEDWF